MSETEKLEKKIRSLESKIATLTAINSATQKELDSLKVMSTLFYVFLSISHSQSPS